MCNLQCLRLCLLSAHDYINSVSANAGVEFRQVCSPAIREVIS